MMKIIYGILSLLTIVTTITTLFVMHGNNLIYLINAGLILLTALLYPKVAVSKTSMTNKNVYIAIGMVEALVIVVSFGLKDYPWLIGIMLVLGAVLPFIYQRYFNYCVQHTS